MFSVSVRRSAGPSKMSSLSGEAQRGVGFGEGGAALREGLGERPAHADGLRALAGEDEGDHRGVAITAAQPGARPPRALWSAAKRDASDDGVAHRLRRRAAVTDDAQARDAEQRRAAVLRIVDALAEAPERPPRQQVAHLARERALQLLAEQLLDHLDQALAQLQRDVAGEAVAHDDVGLAREHVAGFDVADERERRRFEQLVRLARQLVALAFFLADREQPDARRARRRAEPARRPRP